MVQNTNQGMLRSFPPQTYPLHPQEQNTQTSPKQQTRLLTAWRGVRHSTAVSSADTSTARAPETPSPSLPRMGQERKRPQSPHTSDPGDGAKAQRCQHSHSSPRSPPELGSPKVGTSAAPPGAVPTAREEEEECLQGRW